MRAERKHRHKRVVFVVIYRNKDTDTEYRSENIKRLITTTYVIMQILLANNQSLCDVMCQAALAIF